MQAERTVAPELDVPGRKPKTGPMRRPRHRAQQNNLAAFQTKRQVVEDGMRKYAGVQDYKIDVKGNAIVVYTADQDIETLAGLFKDLYPDPTTNPQLLTLLRHEIHYQ